MPKNELVVKSNRLIEASYRLTLNEQRIILYAICRCREQQTGLLPDQPIVITADAFANQFPSARKGHVYQQLKEAMDALYDRSVTLYETDEDSGQEQVSKPDGSAKQAMSTVRDASKLYLRLMLLST